jgi:hypothetical protein
VDCPLDCEYLREARSREKNPPVDPASFPNRDIRISDQFLSEHEALLLFISGSILTASLEIPGVIDYDVREGLEAIIKTYRTLQSGLYYESRPANPMAAHVYERVRQAVEDYRQRLAKESGMATLRDAEFLGIFVFLQRMELQENNGRKKGRAFIDFLQRLLPPQRAESLLA